MYSKILETYLQQMENLKKEMEGLFQEFYLGSSGLWVECLQGVAGEIKTYEIDQLEIECYHKETGGATTDRSDRSAKSDRRNSE